MSDAAQTQLKESPNPDKYKGLDANIAKLPYELQFEIFKYWWPYEKRRRELTIFPFIEKDTNATCQEEMLALKKAGKIIELTQMQAYIAGMQMYDKGVNRVCVIRRLLSNPDYVSSGEMQAYELRNDPDILQYVNVRKKMIQAEYAIELQNLCSS